MKSVWVLVAAFVVLLVVAVLEPRVTVLSAVLAIAFFVSWLVLRHRSHRRGIESPSPSPNIAALPAGILAFGSGRRLRHLPMNILAPSPSLNADAPHAWAAPTSGPPVILCR